jgi:hypothetical protein
MGNCRVKQERAVATVDLTALHEQHQEILFRIKSIKEIIKNRQFINDFDISLLEELNAAVIKHLGMEDMFLYPVLLTHPDLEVQNLANRFINQMGTISNSFTLYKDKYQTISEIKADIDNFILETEFTLSMLSNRIRLEEEKLYPLLTE